MGHFFVCYPAAWAATDHLWRIYFHFWRVHAAGFIQGDYHGWSYSPRNCGAQSYRLMQPWCSCWHQSVATAQAQVVLSVYLFIVCVLRCLFSQKTPYVIEACLLPMLTRLSGGGMWRQPQPRLVKLLDLLWALLQVLTEWCGGRRRVSRSWFLLLVLSYG